MNNAQMTRAFLEKHRAEIDILIAELGLQDQDIRILEGTPDEADLLGLEPEDRVDSASSWATEWFEDVENWGYAIRLGWNNIIDEIDEVDEIGEVIDELQTGLVTVAFCLRCIWQKHILRGGAWHNTIAPQLIAYEAMSHDAHVYSLEAAHRLFGMFLRDEVIEMLSENDRCKWCKSMAMEQRRRNRPPLIVLSA